MTMTKPRKFRSLPEAREFQENPKNPKKKTRKKKSPANFAPKLRKSDPDYYSKIGKISAEKRIRKLGTQYFSSLAKKSHPRAEYHGGRPKKAPKTDDQSSIQTPLADL